MSVDSGEVDRRYRVALLLWGALLGGVVLFAALAGALTAGLLGSWEPFMDRGLARLLLGLAVLLMVAGIVVRRSDWGGAPSAHPLDTWQQRAVVGWALQEGGGFLGVVLALGASNPVWVLLMAGLAVFAMVRTRPTREEVRRVGGGP